MATVILPIALIIAVLIAVGGIAVLYFGVVAPIQGIIDSHSAGDLGAEQIVWGIVWIILSIIAIRILIALFAFACMGAFFGALDD